MLLCGGVIVDHFGHFLLTPLARQWPLLPLSAYRGSLRVLFHGMGDPDRWWAVPYLASCFSVLGLTRANLAWFPGPTRVPCLVGPRPAFEEHNFIHAEYVAFTCAIGVRLAPPTAAQRGPVYLVRTWHGKITLGFVNEQVLVDQAAAEGVAIVYPEDLRFAEHVALFDAAFVVLGPISSTFHPAIFAGASCLLMLLSPTYIVNTNFGMLDRVGGLLAECHFVDPERLPDNPSGRATHQYVIRDVGALARDSERDPQSISAR